MRTKALHEQYAKSIFNYCLRRLRSREEAEDAAQIVFLNAHRCLEEGIEPQSERAWLFKIAEHVVMYRRRTISRRARVEFPVDVDALADLVVAPGRDARAELDGLPEALARIPEAQQRAIVLREWYGLSYREVAAELGISTSAAETLIFRARRRLARELGGPEPTLRRRTPLGLASPLAPLSRWILGGGTTLKALAGVTSVTVLAVGSTRVGLLERPAPRAAATAPRMILPSSPVAAPGALALPTPASVAWQIGTAGARTQRPPTAAGSSVPTPAVVASVDPAGPVAAPDGEGATDSAQVAASAPAISTAAPATDARLEATVESPVSVAELLSAPRDMAPAQPPAVGPVAGGPVDTPAADPGKSGDAHGPVDIRASDPGKSGDAHGPDQAAAPGQAQRSEHVPASAADPGNNPQGAAGRPSGPPPGADHGTSGEGVPGGAAGPPQAADHGQSGGQGASGGPPGPPAFAAGDPQAGNAAVPRPLSEATPNPPAEPDAAATPDSEPPAGAADPAAPPADTAEPPADTVAPPADAAGPPAEPPRAQDDPADPAARESSPPSDNENAAPAGGASGSDPAANG